MRSAWRPLTYAIFSTFFVLLLTACGLVVDNPSLFGGGDAAVSIAVTGPSTVMLGARSQYAAAVKGSSDSSVTWSVNGVAGGNTTIGSISAQGLYAAPASAPEPATVTIAATSVASPAVSQGLPVSLAAPPPDTVNTPVTLALNGAATVTLGTTSQYAATITGSTNTSVTWSVNGVAGGNTSVGSISASGLYTAPATSSQILDVTIAATSVADPSVSQSKLVELGEPPTPPIISSGASGVTVSLSGATSVTLGKTSQYTASVTGSTDTSVIWSVNGTQGGSDAVGLISTNGLYSAPGEASGSSTIIITATSVADPYVSQSLTVALSAPQVPSVTLDLRGPTSVTPGTTSHYKATVQGSSNVSVIWSVNGSIGGDSTVGTISPNGDYSAPISIPASSAVTITATSVAAPSVSRSLNVTFLAPPQVDPVVVVLSGPTTVTLGASARYSASVTGNSNTAVTWSVDGVIGGNSTVGKISTNGRYTAPSAAPNSSNVTVTATSKADSTVSQSLSVALSAPSGSTGGGDPSVVLTLNGPTTVVLGASAQYSATVTGNSNTSVVWSVNGVTGGNSTIGTVSKSGKYKAPAAEPPSSKVTVKATSVADPSVSKSLSVTLAPPQGTGGGDPSVTLALSGPTTVTLGTSAQYSAVVTGSSDIGVIWSVNGIVGGDVTVGIISTKGSYAAPATSNSPKVTITATSQADSSVSQSLSVTLAAPIPSGGTVTLTLSGATSVTLGNTSQYVATVTGSTNTGVTWSVDGVAGGEGSVGTISTKGLYTAPQTAPPSPKVTITATSAADTSVSQSITITLTAPVPTITLTLGGAKTVTLGTTSPYTATVTGSSNTGVTWAVNGVVGGNATNGTISTNGLYSAPSTASQVSTVTIAATSVADSTIAKSIVVALIAPTSTSRIPANAIASSDLNASTRWQWTHDPGTPGSSQGSTVYPVAGLSSDNVAREFYMTYSGHGGEIYHVSFATDKVATHFIYDANVYVVDPSQLANLELDMNDVTADGKTIILGTQCSTYSKSWEYTLVAGGHPHWHASNIPCDPMKWSANTWHHIQIASHRDNSGNATYDWIGMDGKYTDFQNATGPDSLSLGWAKGDLLINFQIDGASKGSGSNTLYTDKLIVYRW